jgi:hypothetical protein
MGVPKGYRPTPEEARVMAGLRELLFPLRPRREGAVFDGFVSNLAADRFPLEQLGVPTLSSAPGMIRWRRTGSPPGRRQRIPEARFVTIERGGHPFLGHGAEVREEIDAFVASVGPDGASP